MELTTKIIIPKASFSIAPCETMLFVGSCFAAEMGKIAEEEKFNATCNPFGVMYNPASILHTLQRFDYSETPSTAILTLGTNHIYILKETGEIVDNCQKRPQQLFTEKELSVDECARYLQQAVDKLKDINPDIHVIITVSPLRYRKYGYHESQLSKATLLLAADKVATENKTTVTYFPAYEIMNDELRDYRFYREDMIHPTPQAVNYIWQRFADTFFSNDTLTFLKLWKPIREALAHRPFNTESEEYKQFIDNTMAQARKLAVKYPNLRL